MNKLFQINVKNLFGNYEFKDIFYHLRIRYETSIEMARYLDLEYEIFEPKHYN